MTILEQDARVITIPRAPRPGHLPYRYAQAGQTYHGIHAAMALIEDQAAVAFEQADGDPDAAAALLAAIGRRFTTAQVERLFDLSGEAEALGSERADRDFWVAVDTYTDYLGHLAMVARTASKGLAS